MNVKTFKNVIFVLEYHNNVKALIEKEKSICCVPDTRSDLSNILAFGLSTFSDNQNSHSHTLSGAANHRLAVHVLMMNPI